MIPVFNDPVECIEHINIWERPVVFVEGARRVGKGWVIENVLKRRMAPQLALDGGRFFRYKTALDWYSDHKDPKSGLVDPKTSPGELDVTQASIWVMESLVQMPRREDLIVFDRSYPTSFVFNYLGKMNESVGLKRFEMWWSLARQLEAAVIFVTASIGTLEKRGRLWNPQLDGMDLLTEQDKFRRSFNMMLNGEHGELKIVELVNNG